MYGEFKKKTVFITGAAKGQGRAVALAFAKYGANIIAFDLKEKTAYPSYNDAKLSDLETLCHEVIALGGKFIAYAGDVRNEEDVKAAVETGVKAFGTIDILFNNAGICAYGYVHELSLKEWDSMIGVNLTGAFLCTKYVVPVMRAQKSGVIINNSSVGGLRGMNRLSHYAASKWALVGLTKSVALENAEYGIRVISIHPTGVNTPMNDGLAEMEGTTPQAIAERSAGNLLPVPWIEPEDVADSVLFLSSSKAKYVTGSQYVLDAGLLTR
ncbi:MAG: SDR family oxidoreductase [Christensenellaceae bacterium]|jgi:NAD(P)-dependent dehydrogenase (short-subunit alcohol dehydrogenase family)|nr:SDR family oxidoreductase [Christensenellaceae bacterium]